MAPKTPKSKIATRNTNLQHKNDDSAALPAIDYAKAQTEEIEVLQAIYMEDFQEVVSQTAWKQVTDHKFKLILRSLSDSETFLTLAVQLTATYPKTTPLLDISGLGDYHERTQQRIRNVVNIRPKQLLGEVMIYALANEIQEALEDAVQAREQGTLPSLEDERANAEETAAEANRQAEASQALEDQRNREEEDRVLKEMVDAEISRNEHKRKSVVAGSKEAIGTAGAEQLESFSFDVAAEIQSGRDTQQFTEVTPVTVLAKKPGTTTYLAKPVSANGLEVPMVVVKRMVFQRSRTEVVEMEKTLTAARMLRHTGLIAILAYRIDRLPDPQSQQLTLCCEYANRGSLYEVLTYGNPHLTTARNFTIGLLEALDHLHAQGLYHGDISVHTAYVVGNGKTTALKLSANFAYTPLQNYGDRIPSKWRAPNADDTLASHRKLDIWHLGVVVAQMFLGLDVTQDYSSPQSLLGKHDLSDSFADFLQSMFTSDYRKRPSAFDLLPSEFLRTDDPVSDGAPLALRGAAGNSADFTSPMRRRSRHNSSSFALESASRYVTDFTELGRLGKGGYGEVVKARNKIDGGVFAIKKIRQAAQLLGQVIQEVMLLNRLNHPYVVRYYSTWVEQDSHPGLGLDDSSTATEIETTTETATDTDDEDEVTGSDGVPRVDFGYQSTGGGLDFVSSNGFPQIEFGDDSEDDSTDDGDDPFERDEEEEADVATPSAVPDDSAAERPRLRPTRSDSLRVVSTLYIQMELCERRNLRDLIRKAMSVDDAWRYTRQITEGLAHIHGHGIIHRDLKPDNVFIDSAGNTKIGDFGLATTAQQIFGDSMSSSAHNGGDMTGNVGTALYTAPELLSKAGTTSSYSDKVDMYSLGIIIFEMCQPFATGTERVLELQKIREKHHVLPAVYQPGGEKQSQGRLVACLVSHKPSERPSSAELLRGDILPVDLKDETIRQALSGLSDPKSPYHQKLMSALFSHESAGTDRIKALAWDAKGPLSNTQDPSRLRLREVAKSALETVFRRHGAEESDRPTLFPKSSYYSQPEIVQLIDASGSLLQLPYDLVLPYARQLARQPPSGQRCSFTFGSAFRDHGKGGPPRMNEEVDFDIMNDHGSPILNRNDAEVLKVMDEAFSEMPLFSSHTTMCFHINHSSILNTIMEHCRVSTVQQQSTKEIISKLGFSKHTWSKVRVELRKFGLPDTTLDDLQTFDFRDTPEKAFARLRSLLASAMPRAKQNLEAGIGSLQRMVDFAAQFNVQRKVYVSPLGSVNAKFYENGMLFQCVLERRATRMVLAAGGRYDALISAHQPIDMRSRSPPGAVGVSIGLETIIATMAKADQGRSTVHSTDESKADGIAKRCTVLVAASGSEHTQNAGNKILASLWLANISAELAVDRSHPVDHAFVVAVKHEAATTVRVTELETDNEEDVPVNALVAHLQQGLREKKRTPGKLPSLLRHASSHEVEKRSNQVQVLLASHGSKKTNKYQIVSAAQDQWSRKLNDAKGAPILAVETTDRVLDLLRQTRLGDAESWRKAAQSVQPGEKKYVEDIQQQLARWRSDWAEKDGMREACVYNFRTQYSIYYDLGA